MQSLTINLKINKLNVLLFIFIFLLSCLNLYSQNCQNGFCSFSIRSNSPQRIISLGPSITEQLYLLGAENRIIANTIYCKRPPQAEKKEKIGSVITVNLEKIFDLKPDLVLATPLTDRRQLQKMKDSKINVVEIPRAKNFQEICKNFLKIGELVGKSKEAKRIIKKAKSRVDLLRKKTKNLPKQKVLVQVGANPLYVATKKYFINDFIEFAGGINIASDTEGGLYSYEMALKQNPDVIIIVEMGIVGEEEKKIWQRYKTLSAARNNRIYIIDGYKLCSPTPINFPETLEELVKILHLDKK